MDVDGRVVSRFNKNNSGMMSVGGVSSCHILHCKSFSWVFRRETYWSILFREFSSISCFLGKLRISGISTNLSVTYAFVIRFAVNDVIRWV